MAARVAGRLQFYSCPVLRPGAFLKNLRVDDLDRLAFDVSENLIEDVVELPFVRVELHIPDVRRAQNVGQIEQRMCRIGQRLLVKYIERRRPRAADAQRIQQDSVRTVCRESRRGW